jgi:hypothetical protein
MMPREAKKRRRGDGDDNTECTRRERKKRRRGDGDDNTHCTPPPGASHDAPQAPAEVLGQDEVYKVFVQRHLLDRRQDRRLNCFDLDVYFNIYIYACHNCLLCLSIKTKYKINKWNNETDCMLHFSTPARLVGGNSISMD